MLFNSVPTRNPTMVFKKFVKLSWFKISATIISNVSDFVKPPIFSLSLVMNSYNRTTVATPLYIDNKHAWFNDFLVIEY